ncbi:hypothetical protein SLEP1_g26240 [Rubroshorea leprosula]|uniref:Uncharacterized protein n=1 Tax=Rubroshorea leprosula TaxID=152421 RepID=A0AAV5JXL8_9ROSI|nr:hypothetical protein SLEP1_g26240 [Rubroshorea leprosula]
MDVLPIYSVGGPDCRMTLLNSSMLKIQNQFQAKMPEISDDSSLSGNDGSSINGGGRRFAATRAICQRLKPSNLVIVRDAQIPLSFAHEELQPHLSAKRRVIALNEKLSSSLMAAAEHPSSATAQQPSSAAKLKIMLQLGRSEAIQLGSSRATQLGSVQLGNRTTAKHGSNKVAQLTAPKQSSSAAANLNSTPAQQKQGSPARQQPSNPARQPQSSLSARRHAPSKFVMKLVEEDASNQHNMMMVSPYLQQIDNTL